MTTATKKRVNRKLKRRLARRQSFIISKLPDLSPSGREVSGGSCSEPAIVESSKAIVERNRQKIANQKSGNGNGKKHKKFYKRDEKKLRQLLINMDHRERKLLFNLLDPSFKCKSDMLIDAGYKPTTSTSPTSVVNRALERNGEAFALLMAKAGISQDAIAAKYAELFNCQVPFVIDRKSGEYIWIPDNRSQISVLELIHKMRGELDNKHTVEVTGKVKHEHEHMIAEEARKRLRAWDENDNEVIDVEAEVIF